jgi:predicted HTH domain antitoxin
MARAKVSLPVPDELAQQLPADPKEQQQVLIWGLREWRVNKALQAYKRGEGSLAYAARQAGISLREMIPLAYAHGVVPKTHSV